MSTEKDKKDILLQAGTNELEIVEFSIGPALYAINIAKVREIIKSEIDIVSVPDSHKSIEGVINLRGKIIPVINLAHHLKIESPKDKKNNRIIISEFNKIIVGFYVSSVANIHRLSWKQVEKPAEIIQTEQGYAVGVIKINNKVLFLLDFEKIAGHINPNAGMNKANKEEYHAKKDLNRSTKTILVAEDSEFIKNLILDHLKSAGYKYVSANNGEEAWKHLSDVIDLPNFDTIERFFNLVITDIEMPQMDGLHLIKKIKEHPKTRKLRCVAFSSMISPELVQKCKSVGSDGEISKPEIQQLISLVDTLVI